jgi:hypothetical protein
MDLTDLCAFYPDQINLDSQPPALALTNFRLLNKSVAIGNKNNPTPLTKVINHTQSLTLTHQDNVLSFEFAALHYNQPWPNQYKYKLEGFNQDWIATDARKRYASYTNLSAGTYTFRVKASNNKGVWNENERTVELIILPAPWRTQRATSAGRYRRKRPI